MLEETHQSDSFTDFTASRGSLLKELGGGMGADGTWYSKEGVRR